MNVKAGVINDPVVPVPPPPVEMQEVLFVDAQFSVDFEPYAIEDGVAVSVTPGGAVATPTLTVELWLAVPPGPVQVTE